jgi:hypothetical protein
MPGLSVASGPAIILLAAAAFGVVYLTTGGARQLGGWGRRAERSALNSGLNAERH